MQTPDSTILPHGAAKIEERLENFHQWSELSQGYVSSENLIRSCILDAYGKVNSPAKVTDLTGETWIIAAKLYLHCRFYRCSLHGVRASPKKNSLFIRSIW